MPDRDLIAEGRRLLAAASEGEWAVWRDLDNQGFYTVGDEDGVLTADKPETASCNPVAHVYIEPDAELIVHMRNTYGELLDELEQSLARIGFLESARDQNATGWRRVAQKWRRHAIARRGELYTVYDVLDLRTACAEGSAANAHIAELEKQAKAGEQFDALLSLMAWRCTSTTTMANTIPGDDRAVWCTLPKGHAGMHHGEMPQCVPTGIEGFSKQEPMGMDWPEVSSNG